MKTDDISVWPAQRTSFQAGISYQCRLIRAPFYLETGLYASDKGVKYVLEEIEYAENRTYIQLPLMVSYHCYLSKNTSLQPFAGVYYGLAVVGKETISHQGVSLEHNVFEKETIEDYVVYPSRKRSDFGLRLGMGINLLKHYYACVGYDLGLTDIAKVAPGVEKETKVRNGSLFVMVGYTF